MSAANVGDGSLDSVRWVDTAARAHDRSGAAELTRLIEDVEVLLSRVANVADVDIAQLRQRLGERISFARDVMTTGVRRVSDRARAAATATDELVHQAPWQFLGGALLAGVVIGWLLPRR